jgi:hypothetical protein
MSAPTHTVMLMGLFRYRFPRVPADETLAFAVGDARRGVALARSAVDRAFDDELLDVVGDLAEAVRCMQTGLAEALTVSRRKGISWEELADYSGTSAEYLQEAHERYDGEARLSLDRERQARWRPLG